MQFLMTKKDLIEYFYEPLVGTDIAELQASVESLKNSETEHSAKIATVLERMLEQVFEADLKLKVENL